MKKIRILFLGIILVLGLSFVQSTNAQTVDDPLIKACEQTADLAKRLEIENASLKAQLQLEKEKVTVERERSVMISEQRDFYKTAYEKVGKVDTNSSMIIDNLRVQVNDYRIENADLRRENSKLRDSRNIRTLVGFGVGLGTGVYLNKK